MRGSGVRARTEGCWEALEETKAGNRIMAKAATIMRDEEGLVGKMKALPERISSFLSDVRNEMRKVTFPSRKEVQATTLVVIITVIIFGAFFAVVDQAMGNGVAWVLKHSK
jgi:preprotein translocase subunit SecE